MTGNKHNHKPHIHRKARNSSCCYMIICVEIKSPIAINACNICSYQKTIRNDAPVKSLAYQKFVHIQSIAYECVNVRLCVCVYRILRVGYILLAITIWKKINLKVCRNFGDTCQRLQVHKFIALHSFVLNRKNGSLPFYLWTDGNFSVTETFSRCDVGGLIQNGKEIIRKLLTNYLLVILLILYLGLIAFSDLLRGTDAAKI